MRGRDLNCREAVGAFDGPACRSTGEKQYRQSRHRGHGCRSPIGRYAGHLHSSACGTSNGPNSSTCLAISVSCSTVRRSPSLLIEDSRFRGKKESDFAREIESYQTDGISVLTRSGPREGVIEVPVVSANSHV
jgi:hypothetical protein